MAIIRRVVLEEEERKRRKRIIGVRKEDKNVEKVEKEKEGGGREGALGGEGRGEEETSMKSIRRCEKKKEKEKDEG